MAADALLADPALRTLEMDARARPMGSVAALAAYAQRLPEAEPRRVFATALRATILASHGDLDGARAALPALQALATQDAGAAAALAWVQAGIARREGTLHRPIRLLTEGLARLPASGHELLRHHLTQALARMQLDQGQLDEAVRLGQQLVLVADRLGPDWRASEARNTLAYSLIIANQFERAAALHDEASTLARLAGDELAVAHTLNTASFLHSHAGNREAELAAMTGTIDAARRANAPEMEVLGLANLSDHYLQRGDFSTALRMAEQALPLARRLGDANSESVALANIGLALVSLRRLDEGMAVLNQAAAIEERASARNNLAQLLAEQGHYLERAGYLREAYAAYRRQRELDDALFRRDHQQAMAELQEGFDGQRRARELAQLQRDKRLKETELHNRSLQSRVWATAAVVGLLLLGVAGVLLRRLRRHSAALVAGNATLRTQSEVDPLTGLANRRHLLRRMQPAEAAAGPAPSGFDGALLLLDLDHFKQVNDRHGHAVGDAVLVGVAQRLRSALRDDDLVVRWGGEEFLIVSPSLDEAAASALAQRLLNTLALTPLDTPAGPLPVSASIGFATFPLPPDGLAMPWERAVDLVDAALYLAKSHGRNRACGVRRLQLADPQALYDVSRRLDAAWRDGEVTLTELSGPPLPGGLAPGLPPVREATPA